MIKYIKKEKLILRSPQADKDDKRKLTISSDRYQNSLLHERVIHVNLQYMTRSKGNIQDKREYHEYEITQLKYFQNILRRNYDSHLIFVK